MINISAIIQIAILYFIILAILKAAKGSRFGQVLMGAGIIAAAMIAFTYVFKFDVLSTIVRSILVYLAISTVVIFQPEIRRILSQVGALGYFEKPKYGVGRFHNRHHHFAIRPQNGSAHRHRTRHFAARLRIDRRGDRRHFHSRARDDHLHASPAIARRRRDPALWARGAELLAFHRAARAA